MDVINDRMKAPHGIRMVIKFKRTIFLHFKNVSFHYFKSETYQRYNVMHFNYKYSYLMRNDFSVYFPII